MELGTGSFTGIDTTILSTEFLPVHCRTAAGQNLFELGKVLNQGAGSDNLMKCNLAISRSKCLKWA